MFLPCACIWYATFLLVLLFKIVFDSCVSCMCNFVLSFIGSCVDLNWLFWDINGLSHFGGVKCFVHFTNLKMCVHEGHHLVLIFQYYLATMWYVIFMRNSNSTCPLISLVGLFASCSKIKWIITLWGSNKLCACYNPIKMWIFEVAT